MNRSCFIIFILLFASCEPAPKFSAQDVEQSIALIPQFNLKDLVFDGNTLEYEVESNPFFADKLILRKNGGKIEQERRITIQKEAGSLVFNLPKSFASTTDDLTIHFQGETSGPEWKVIEKDPIIELVNIKKDQIKKAIIIKTAVDLLDKGQDFFEVAERQAKLHQVLNLLQKTEEMDDIALKELFILAVISKYPEVFRGPVEILGDNACDYFDDEIKANICKAMTNGNHVVCEQYQGDRKQACQTYLFHALISRAGSEISDQQLLEIIKLSGYKKGCSPLTGEVKKKCLALFENSRKPASEDVKSDAEKVIVSSKMEDIYHAEVDCADIASGGNVRKTASWDPDDVIYRKWPKGEIQCDLRFEALAYPNHCIVNIRPFEKESEYLSYHQADFRDDPDKFRKVVMQGEIVYVTEFYNYNRIFIQCGKNVPYEEVNAKARALIDRKIPIE